MRTARHAASARGAARACALACAVGLGLRLWGAWTADWKLLGDEAEYMLCARRLATDGAYLEGRFVRVPGQCALMGGLGAVLGTRAIPLATGVAQALLAALGVWLVFRLGRRLAGGTVGAGAAWIYALLPEAVYYSHRLWPDVTLGFACALALVLAVEGNATLRRAAAVGLACGGALLLKPVGLVLLPSAAAAVAARAAGARRRAALAAVVLIVAGATVLPWGLRNLSRHGRLFLENNTGYALMRATSGGGELQRFWSRHPMADRDAVARREAMRRIAADPGRYARHVGGNLTALLVRHDLLVRRYRAPAFVEALAVLQFPAWALVVACAVFALRAWRRLWPPLALAALALGSHALVFGKPRYREMVLPCLAVLAAVGLGRLRVLAREWRAGARRAPRGALPEALLVALFATWAAATWPPGPRRDPPLPSGYTRTTAQE